MNILVTGCAGFIGSHLCEQLVRENHVIGIDNFDPFYSRNIKEQNLKNLCKVSNFKFIEADVCNALSLDQLRGSIDLIVHLAAKPGVAPSIQQPASYIETNVNGTLQVLDFMIRRGIKKIVFGSSSSVYGNSQNIPFHEEQSTDSPLSPYAFSKKSAEVLVNTYTNLYGLHSVILRFFTVYGPRQRPDLAIHKFFNCILNKTSIPFFGDGNTSRDYTYISDIVNGIDAAIDYCISSCPKSDVFNLGNHHPVSLTSLVQLIEQTCGIKPEIKMTDIPSGDMLVTFADIGKAKDKLNYYPKVDIKSGLQQFWDWKRTFLSALF